jgi:hypothetical protein
MMPFRRLALLLEIRMSVTFRSLAWRLPAGRMPANTDIGLTVDLTDVTVDDQVLWSCDTPGVTFDLANNPSDVDVGGANPGSFYSSTKVFVATTITEDIVIRAEVVRDPSHNAGRAEYRVIPIHMPGGIYMNKPSARNPPSGLNTDPEDEEQIIEFVVRLTDEHGASVPEWPVDVSFDHAYSLSVFSGEDHSFLEPMLDPESVVARYELATDDQGSMRVLVGSRTPTISSGSAIARGAGGTRQTLIMASINPEPPSSSLPLPNTTPLVNNGFLQLSADDKTIGVSANRSADTSYLPAYPIVFCLNDSFGRIATYAEVAASVDNRMSTGLIYFTGTDGGTSPVPNALSYLVQGPTSAVQSPVYTFYAEGVAVDGPGDNRPRSLPMPTIDVPVELLEPWVGAQLVNADAIKDGLTLRIPAYRGIAVGDEVTVNVYLNAYVSGSDRPKVDILGLHRVLGAEDLAGPVFHLDKENLLGFDEPRNLRMTGRFRAEYNVIMANDAFRRPIWSFVLGDNPLVPLGTVIPF